MTEEQGQNRKTKFRRAFKSFELEGTRRRGHRLPEQTGDAEAGSAALVQDDLFADQRGRSFTTFVARQAFRKEASPQVGDEMS